LPVGFVLSALFLDDSFTPLIWCNLWRMDWIFNNWAELALGLLAFADLLVSLNPKWTGSKLGYIRAVVVALAAARPTPQANDKIEKRNG